MTSKIIIMPVLIVTLAVGFILNRGPGVADEISVSSGAESNYSANAQSGVPDDIYFSQPVKSVVFSHKTHALDLGFKCDSCHTGLFQMKAHNAESQPDFNMKGLAEGKYCGSCHSSKSNAAFASDTQCARCHRGVKGLERVVENGQ